MTMLRLLPVLLLAACATRSVLEESRAFAARNDHARAFLVLDRKVAEYEADGAEPPQPLAEAHAAALREHLFRRAEERIFGEREDAALADLAELADLAPDFPGLGAMRDRALAKKATRIVTAAQESFVRKDYAAALAGCLEADKVVPGFPLAKQGMEDVRKATAAMNLRAQEQFLEAVRKLPEFRYMEVQWHAANALHNDPQRGEAKELQAKARRENAMKAMARARESESKGRYGAALVEYRAARAVDASTPGVEAAIDSMQREVKAQGLVDGAQIDMNAGRTDAARAKLDQARELSVLMRNDISVMLVDVQKAEAKVRYRAARDLEVLGRKLDALQAFVALAESYPVGVDDEKARIAGLKADVEGWARHWSAADAAEAAGDLDKALEEGLEGQRFYARAEGKERLDRLRAAIAARKQQTPPDGQR
ncbi:MAG: hypothetical protein INH34_07570 [Phycisphaerales bacterium]|nr:hypothetical protein [Phycisphaerales bacterium]